jgi:hypothetical protein
MLQSSFDINVVLDAFVAGAQGGDLQPPTEDERFSAEYAQDHSEVLQLIISFK